MGRYSGHGREDDCAEQGKERTAGSDESRQSISFVCHTKLPSGATMGGAEMEYLQAMTMEATAVFGLAKD